MRFLFILCLFTFPLYAQEGANVEELEELKEIKVSLEQNIADLQSQLNRVNKQIKEKESLISNPEGLQSSGIPAIITKDQTRLLKEASYKSKDVLTLSDGDTVYVIDFRNEYFLTESRFGTGWVLDNRIGGINAEARKKMDQVQAVGTKKGIEEKQKEVARKEQAWAANEKKKREAAAAVRKSYINRKYSSEIARKILNRSYWVGMTKEMARDSLGEPGDINRTVSGQGVHEQWVYDNYDVYLYFENGKCTSFQD